ncbi:MAG: inositol monophosphatase [Candidatus Micrarchaeota archaeon]|nr:inositol monophosphatase [Candidatus Micrarchaeota archaeon]
MSGMQQFIEACLKGAAQEIAKARKAGLTIKAKARNDKATSADLAAEKFVVGEIAREFPDSAVLSEESYLKADLEHGSLFVIDPIDGTHNFIQGIPLWGVSIAHFSKGKPTAGGIYLVPQQEMLYAEKGKHATLNGKKIAVAGTAKLEDFFLLCDTRLHRISEQGFLPHLVEIEKISQHTRFLGSTVHDMGYVACGRADACMSFKLKPYDFAAAAFIAERAGATATDLEGKPWGLSTERFLVSNGAQHRRILDVLHGKG